MKMDHWIAYIRASVPKTRREAVGIVTKIIAIKEQKGDAGSRLGRSRSPCALPKGMKKIASFLKTDLLLALSLSIEGTELSPR